MGEEKSEDLEVLLVKEGGPPPVKKVRRIPEQVAAAACPVFEASAADLLNFDAIIQHLWHEKQAWRSGIAKVILKPCALKAIYDGEDVKCFWSEFSKVPITRVSKQLVRKEDKGLFIVERTNEMVSGVETVSSFVEKASGKGLVHPSQGEKQQETLPTAFTTAESRRHEEDWLLNNIRKDFWLGLDKLNVGESTPEMEYVTELNLEPIPDHELDERFEAPGPKRKEVSYCCEVHF